MEVYAAQIERMDRGIGRILEALEETGQWRRTVILFLADNGGCAEEITEDWAAWMLGQIAHAETRDGRRVQFGNDPEVMPGGDDSYQSYGVPWANVSNTPFREYKHWVHEGGIATPLIVHWPDGIGDPGGLRHAPAQLPDIMATCLDLAGADYPKTRKGHDLPPCEGFSMAPLLEGDSFGREVLYWEHEGNRAVRRGRWKLVTKYPGDWELYDIERDRTELNDLSRQHPEVVAELAALYDAWADRCSVMPWAELLALRRDRREQGA